MFLVLSYVFMFVLWFFIGSTSIPQGKNKRIQALVNVYLLLTQQFECNMYTLKC